MNVLEKKYSFHLRQTLLGQFCLAKMWFLNFDILYFFFCTLKLSFGSFPCHMREWLIIEGSKGKCIAIALRDVFFRRNCSGLLSKEKRKSRGTKMNEDSSVHPADLGVYIPVFFLIGIRIVDPFSLSLVHSLCADTYCCCCCCRCRGVLSCWWITSICIGWQIIIHLVSLQREH